MAVAEARYEGVIRLQAAEIASMACVGVST